MSRKRKTELGAITTRIERLDLRELELLELNARFMRHETYVQLVANIKRDGCLTSVPFAWLNPESGKYRVLSGNHRVQAAIDAEVFEADVMLTDDELPEEHRVAIQLAHNALVGEDDASTLRELYDKLDVDLRIYTGLDDEQLGMIEKPDLDSLAEVNLDWSSVAFLFLPKERDIALEAFDQARDKLAVDELWVAPGCYYDATLDAIAEANAAHGIRNVATGLGVVLAIYERHKTDLAEGWLADDGSTRHGGMVPLSSVLGTDRVPAPIAAALRREVERIVGQQQVTPLEALVALLADRPEGDESGRRPGPERAREEPPAGDAHEGPDRDRPRKRRARAARGSRRRPKAGT